MACIALPLLLALATGPLVAPRVASVAPPGAQRGTEVKVTFRGERLLEPQGVLCSRPGLEVVSIQPVGERNDQCEAVLKVAADCALGAHVLRLRTAHGLSNAVLFHVGLLPAHEERREGDAPMTIPLDATVHGTVAAETVDAYLVDVPQGTVVTCELESFRLGRAATDLALAVEGPLAPWSRAPTTPTSASRTRSSPSRLPPPAPTGSSCGLPGPRPPQVPTACTWAGSSDRWARCPAAASRARTSRWNCSGAPRARRHA